MDRIKKLLEDSPSNIKGKIIEEHIILDIVGEEVHYWSPQLNFRVEKDEKNLNHSIVSGLIGPRPAVWTLFMFIYFSIGTIGFFISAFAISKMLLGEYSRLLFVLPLSIIFMLTAYIVGKYGEKLAKTQIDLLKQFVRDTTYFDRSKKD